MKPSLQFPLVPHFDIDPFVQRQFDEIKGLLYGCSGTGSESLKTCCNLHDDIRFFCFFIWLFNKKKFSSNWRSSNSWCCGNSDIVVLCSALRDRKKNELQRVDQYFFIYIPYYFFKTMWVQNFQEILSGIFLSYSK